MKARAPAGPAAISPMLWLALVITVGLALRLNQIGITRLAPIPPDVPLGIAARMAHAYDTQVREPLFVWWLWFWLKMGVSDFLKLRVFTMLFFAPTAVLLYQVSRRWLSLTWALLTVAAYSLLPTQVWADSSGERHVLEVFLLLLFCWALWNQSARPKVRLAVLSTAFAALLLTRINLAVSCLALVAMSYRSFRRPREILVVLLPGILLLAPYLAYCHHTFGDTFHAINVHSYWFANREFIGTPGYAPTMEEWQKDPYRPSLTYFQWAFRAHPLDVYVFETLLGYVRIGFGYFALKYFAEGVPDLIRWVMVAAYMAGLVSVGRQPERRPLAWLLFWFILPYAFVSHVFTAPRFYFVLVPAILILAALILEDLWNRGLRVFRRLS